MAPAEYDDEGNVLERTEVKEYQIMAARMRNDRFSYPFVLAAELDHAVDTVTVLEDDSRACMSVLTTQTEHVTDGNVQSGEGRVHFVVVPHIACASIADAQAMTPALPTGSTLPFYVTIRNDGNTYLSGVTVQLSLDEDGKRDEILAEAALAFSAESIVESTYNPKGDDGILENVEDDYKLAPGATSVYQAEFVRPGSSDPFVIPDGWGGYYDLLVTLKPDSLVLTEGEELRLAGAYRHTVRAAYDADGVPRAAAENTVDLSSIGENGLLVFYEPAHEEMTKLLGDGTRVPAGRSMLSVAGQDREASAARLSAAPVTFVGASGGGTSGGGASGGGAARGGGSAGRGQRLPQTGDPTSALDAVPAALGVAGAAMVAYSHRRTQIESERADD